MQEFGEGVDRMYMEMEKAGLPAPEYRVNAFMLNVTIRNGGTMGVTERVTEKVTEKENEILVLLYQVEQSQTYCCDDE